METHSPRARFTVLADRRTLSDAQPLGLREELRRRGHEVRSVDARSAFDAGEDSWVRSSDLVVARGISVELLSLLRRAEAHGVPVFHSASSISAVRNQGRALTRLGAAGVPVAPEAACASGSPARDHAGGCTREIHSIGESSIVRPDGPGPPAEVSPALGALIARCRSLLRLRLLATTWTCSERPALTGVEAFPGYEGVAEASVLLSCEIESALEDARR
jgi:hypothetical protein